MRRRNNKNLRAIDVIVNFIHLITLKLYEMPDNIPSVVEFLWLFLVGIFNLFGTAKHFGWNRFFTTMPSARNINFCNSSLTTCSPFSWVGIWGRLVIYHLLFCLLGYLQGKDCCGNILNMCLHGILKSVYLWHSFVIIPRD